MTACHADLIRSAFESYDLSGLFDEASKISKNHFVRGFTHTALPDKIIYQERIYSRFGVKQR